MREPATRLNRRRAHTRAALIGAARRLLAEDRTAVSVLEITETADVGLGSFYNHFESKQDLFDAAIEEMLEAHGRLMDAVSEGIADPAEAFTRSFRLTGRLHRRYPGASQVLLNHGTRVLISDHGLPIWLGIALAMLLSALGAAVIERLFIRPFDPSNHLAITIVTLAWFGLIMRVYHDAVSQRRGSATAQQRRRAVADEEAE